MMQLWWLVVYRIWGWDPISQPALALKSRLRDPLRAGEALQEGHLTGCHVRAGVICHQTCETLFTELCSILENGKHS